LAVAEMLGWVAVGLGVLLAVWLGVQTARLARLEKQYRSLMKGTGRIASPGVPALPLGDLIAMQGARIDATREDVAGLRQAATVLDEQAARSVQHVGLVRYNPFEDTGGDQSFAIALLDRQGNGVVISSLHGRTATRFYAKSIKGGTSSLNLSAEEVKAVEQAMGKKDK
jgi:Protein of unknown function (DUF4446)